MRFFFGTIACKIWVKIKLSTEMRWTFNNTHTHTLSQHTLQLTHCNKTESFAFFIILEELSTMMINFLLPTFECVIFYQLEAIVSPYYICTFFKWKTFDSVKQNRAKQNYVAFRIEMMMMTMLGFRLRSHQLGTCI